MRARARARVKNVAARASRRPPSRVRPTSSFFSTCIVSRNTRTSLEPLFSPRVSRAHPRLALATPTPSHRDADGNDGDDDDGDDGDDDATLETEDATRRERSRVGWCVSNAAMDRTTARATDRALERATRGVMNTAWNEWER